MTNSTSLGLRSMKGMELAFIIGTIILDSFANFPGNCTRIDR